MDSINNLRAFGQLKEDRIDYLLKFDVEGKNAETLIKDGQKENKKKDKKNKMKDNIFFSGEQSEIIIPMAKKKILDIKKSSNETFHLINRKKMNNKLRENIEKIISNSKIRNIIRKRNCSSIFIINFIIINLFIRAISNIFDYFYAKDSKITLKVKGIGYSYIFGNATNYYFKNISYLNEVRVNGNIQETIDFRYYFDQEDNTVELIWNEEIKSCENMFWGCTNITEINLSNFITTQVISMSYMFYSCTSLVKLELTNIDTSNVIYMAYMFARCLLLNSLDLSNFNTSKVEIMSHMFNNCPSLSSLELSNFETSHLESMFGMFRGCSSLNSLNLSNFDTSQVYDMEYLFYECKNLKYINLNNFDEISINDDSNFYDDIFYKVPKNVVICIKENITKNIIFPQIKQIECYVIDCTDNWKSNRKKIINNTNECVEICGESLEYKYEYDGKCYENCTYNYYIDGGNNYYCTSDSLCPEEYPILIENKMKCIKYDVQNMINEIFTNEKNDTEKMSKEEKIKYYDKFLQGVEEVFFSNNYNTSNLDNGKDEVIETEKMTITFTTSRNQKNNANINTTSIDLGECETLLRNHYNISNNEELYIKKIDVVQEGMSAMKIEYDIYSKLFGKNLIKLNLTVCEKSKISILIPIKTNDNIDVLNISSGYYNDRCYTTTSEDGTDISLKDRQTEFANKDKIICQENCELSEYDQETSKAKCSCQVKEASSSVADMHINKDKILQNFKDIKNIVNIDFLVCYKKLLQKENLVKNIGFYMILFIIIFHIITIIIFIINQFPLLKNKIKKIIYQIYEYHSVNENKNVENKKPKILKNSKGRGFLIVKKNIKNNISIKLSQRISHL